MSSTYSIVEGRSESYVSSRCVTCLVSFSIVHLFRLTTNTIGTKFGIGISIKLSRTE